MREKGFAVVVAADGSRAGRAAVAAAAAAGYRVLGVVTRRPGSRQASAPALALAIDSAIGQIARAARRTLVRRWPTAESCPRGEC